MVQCLQQEVLRLRPDLINNILVQEHIMHGLEVKLEHMDRWLHDEPEEPPPQDNMGAWSLENSKPATAYVEDAFTGDAFAALRGGQGGRADAIRQVRMEARIEEEERRVDKEAREDEDARARQREKAEQGVKYAGALADRMEVVRQELEAELAAGGSVHAWLEHEAEDTAEQMRRMRRLAGMEGVLPDESPRLEPIEAPQVEEEPKTRHRSRSAEFMNESRSRSSSTSAEVEIMAKTQAEAEVELAVTYEEALELAAKVEAMPEGPEKEAAAARLEAMQNELKAKEAALKTKFPKVTKALSPRTEDVNHLLDHLSPDRTQEEEPDRALTAAEQARARLLQSQQEAKEDEEEKAERERDENEERLGDSFENVTKVLEALRENGMLPFELLNEMDKGELADMVEALDVEVEI